MLVKVVLRGKRLPVLPRYTVDVLAKVDQAAYNTQAPSTNILSTLLELKIAPQDYKVTCLSCLHGVDCTVAAWSDAAGQASGAWMAF